MSDVEKRSTHDSQYENHVGAIETIPADPDAHLSQEEKDKIVSIHHRSSEASSDLLSAPFNAFQLRLTTLIRIAS